MKIEGKYTIAQVYTTKDAATAIDDYAVAQIQALVDNPIHEGCKVVVMPDVHPGVVGTIGSQSNNTPDLLLCSYSNEALSNQSHLPSDAPDF